MKRKIIIAMLTVCTALCCAFGLAACSGGNNRSVTEDCITYEPIRDGYALYFYIGEEYFGFVEDGLPEEYKDAYIATIMYEDISKVDGKDVVIPSTVNGKPVIGIGDGFSQSGIKSIVIPDSVKLIQRGLFAGCTKLESATLPEGIEELDLFERCTSLKTVNIPNSVTKISSYEFSGCTSLENITIPENVTEIDDDAFLDCTALKSVVIPDSVKKLGSYAFSGCTSLETLTVPEIEESGLGNEVFANCKIKNLTVSADNINSFRYDKSQLENVVITGGEVIDSGTFAFAGGGMREYEFTDLPLNITLPSTIKQVGFEGYNNVFSDRKNITLNFTDADALFGISFLGSWVGYYRSGEFTSHPCNIQLKIGGEVVTSLKVPANVDEISTNMLNGINTLESITVDENNSKYFAQDSVLYNKNKTEILLVPDWIKGSVTVPYGITAIESEFKWSKITELHLPDSITSIKEKALGCKMLESLTVPFVGLTKNETGNKYFYKIFNDSPENLKTLTINGGTYTEFSFDLQYKYKIENLIFGDGVTEVNRVSLPDLRTVTIGKNVRSINLYANKLVEIYNYSDIVIEKGSDKNGGIGLNALGIYTSADVQSKVKTTDDGYIIFEDGNEVYLIGYNGNEQNLVLPEKINGKNYGIHNYAFRLEWINNGYDSSTDTVDIEYKTVCLKSITIPDGVQSIGNNAFESQHFLEEVQLGTGVKQIGGYVFNGCSSLKSIELYGIETIGEYAFNGCESLKSIELPDIEIIGAYAFGSCSELESITLGNGIREIGNRAFYLWGEGNIQSITAPAEALEYIPHEKLKSVNITGGTAIPDYAFHNCTTLETVEIANTVTKIGNYAFNGCSNVTSITIPESINELGIAVFTGCSGLSTTASDGVSYINNFVVSCDPEVTTVTIREGTTHILEYAFENCAQIESVVIPDSVVYIRTGAFKNCEKLASVKLSDNVTAINAETFYGCTSLVSLTAKQAARTADQGIIIPDSVRTIGDLAFAYCENLKSIVIPDGAELGYGIMYNCYNIENVVMPASAISQINSKYNLKTVVITSGDSIEEGAFKGANKLESITLPFIGGGKATKGNLSQMFGFIFGMEEYDGSVEAVQQHTFMNGYAYTASFYLPATLTDVTITGGYMYEGCFSGCTNIKNITFGGDCDFSQIEMRAFYGCTSLERFVVPESVEVIEQEAFSGCTSLAELNLSNTYFVRGLAFENCTSLEHLVIPRSVVDIYARAFEGCTSLGSVEFVLTDWVRASENNLNSQSLVDVSDPAQNAVNIRGAWRGFVLMNLTRMTEYY